MPTYEYRCVKGHEYEVVQRMSDEPLALCPKCGAKAERLLSAGAGLLFKGEGFYITDYRSDAYRKAASADTKSGDGGKTTGSEKGGDAGKGGETGKGGDTGKKEPSKSPPESGASPKTTGSKPSSGPSGT